MPARQSHFLRYCTSALQLSSTPDPCLIPIGEPYPVARPDLARFFVRTSTSMQPLTSVVNRNEFRFMHTTDITFFSPTEHRIELPLGVGSNLSTSFSFSVPSFLWTLLVRLRTYPYPSSLSPRFTSHNAAEKEGECPAKRA